LFHLKEIVLKNIIKQTGFVFFFGLLTRGFFDCNSSDNKKIVSSESDKMATIDGSGSLGSADGTGTTSRNYFLSILIIIIIILVSGGCEVKVVVLDPAAEKVKVIREFEPTAEDITQDLITNYGRDAETDWYMISGTRWTEEFKNWISKGEGISFEEEEEAHGPWSEGYNVYASGMMEGCESIKFVTYNLGNDIIRTSDTIHTVAYRLPYQLPPPFFGLPYKTGTCDHMPGTVENCGGGGSLSWAFADESTRMKQLQNVAKQFGLIHGANYAIIHRLDKFFFSLGTEMTLGLYKCSE